EPHPAGHFFSSGSRSPTYGTGMNRLRAWPSMFLLATSLAASLSGCDGDDTQEKLDGGADSGARRTDASAQADRDASAGRGAETRDAATAGNSACDLLAQD